MDYIRPRSVIKLASYALLPDFIIIRHEIGGSIVAVAFEFLSLGVQEDVLAFTKVFNSLEVQNLSLGWLKSIANPIMVQL